MGGHAWAPPRLPGWVRLHWLQAWFLATGRGSRLLRAGIPGSGPQKLWLPPSLKDGWLFRHISWATQASVVRYGWGHVAGRLPGGGVPRGPLGGCCSPERPVTAWQEEAAGGPADGHWPAHAACAHRLCPRAAPKSWGRGLCSPHLSPAVLWAQFDLQLLWEAPWASWLWGPRSLAAHARLVWLTRPSAWGEHCAWALPFWFRLHTRACGSWPWHGELLHVGPAARAGPPAMSVAYPSAAARLALGSRAWEVQVPEKVQGSGGVGAARSTGPGGSQEESVC